MDENPSRSRSKAPDHPRSVTEREWEVFIRETTADPLQHVGSVTAPSAEIAHEQAEGLFNRFARDIWLCPADSIHRYTVTSEGAQPRESGSSEQATVDGNSRTAASER